MSIVKIFKYCKKILLIIIIEVILLCLLLMTVEGFLSWYHFFHDVVVNNYKVKEELHTEYSPLLGWINKPNVHIPNIYGPNIYLSTDENRFRTTPKNTNQGTYKVICTGDSFTLGYGVNDSQPWCSLLSNGNLQTYNMGQGGYGIDQNYLWYKEGAQNINHSFHIMAFIPDDFDRAGLSTFAGYDKPYFQIKNGELLNTNYPVPRPKYFQRFIFLNKDTLDRLNIFQTAAHIRKIIMDIYTHNNVDANNSNSNEVVTEIFKNLVGLTVERGATPIVVLLPSNYDITNKDHYLNEYNKRKEFLENMSVKYNCIFIDMGKYMFSTDQNKYNSLFLPINNHYTDKTNELVAKTIRSVINKYLVNHPKLSEKNIPYLNLK